MHMCCLYRANLHANWPLPSECDFPVSYYHDLHEGKGIRCRFSSRPYEDFSGTYTQIVRLKKAIRCRMIVKLHSLAVLANRRRTKKPRTLRIIVINNLISMLIPYQRSSVILYLPRLGYLGRYLWI